MQACKENAEVRDSGWEWIYEDIEKHQEAMIDVLIGAANAKRTI